MAPIDLDALTRHVRAILVCPHLSVPATGDYALDRALADLAQHGRGHLPVEPGLPYWLSLPPHEPALIQHR